MTPLTDEQYAEVFKGNISTSDCGVVAFQAVTGLPYVEAEQRMTDHGGYTPGSGTPRGGIELALAMLGYDAEVVELETQESPASLAVREEYGSFLIYIDTHVMALVEGNLYNARSFTGSPVEAFIKITKEN